MSVLIGLTGQAASGKDTAFGYIQEWADEHQLIAARRAFADMLKWSFARMFTPDCTIDEAVSWCNRFKNRGLLVAQEQVNPEGYPAQTQVFRQEITGRAALQRYGTEAHRDLFGMDFWVDALLPPDMPYVDNFYDPQTMPVLLPDICVITDVRYGNEIAAIEQQNGSVWKIDRGVSMLLSDNHASESDLKDFEADLIIYNTGTFEEFRDAVRNAMNIHMSVLQMQDSE